MQLCSGTRLGGSSGCYVGAKCWAVRNFMVFHSSTCWWWIGLGQRWFLQWLKPSVLIWVEVKRFPKWNPNQCKLKFRNLHITRGIILGQSIEIQVGERGKKVLNQIKSSRVGFAKKIFAIELKAFSISFDLLQGLRFLLQGCQKLDTKLTALLKQTSSA